MHGLHHGPRVMGIMQGTRVFFLSTSLHENALAKPLHLLPSDYHV